MTTQNSPKKFETLKALIAQIFGVSRNLETRPSREINRKLFSYDFELDIAHIREFPRHFPRKYAEIDSEN